MPTVKIGSDEMEWGLDDVADFLSLYGPIEVELDKGHVWLYVRKEEMDGAYPTGPICQLLVYHINFSQNKWAYRVFHQDENQFSRWTFTNADDLLEAIKLWQTKKSEQEVTP